MNRRPRFLAQARDLPENNLCILHRLIRESQILKASPSGRRACATFARHRDYHNRCSQKKQRRSIEFYEKNMYTEKLKTADGDPPVALGAKSGLRTSGTETDPAKWDGRQPDGIKWRETNG
ncbi:MAG: hypothetical protein LUF35_05475 [Lachnospiraceae bacterium]|nr:hypothetical protein [Lachnospiraceae bacterium]